MEKTQEKILLSDKHMQDLRDSGLADDSIKDYGFMTVTKDEATKLLGRTSPSGGLKIPYLGTDFCKIKPDNPEKDAKGKDIKYLAPYNKEQPLYITYSARSVRDDLTSPYYIVEGEKKAIAMEQAKYPTIGIAGVWNWSKDKHIKEDFKKLNIKGRNIYIVFDSDKYENESTKNAEIKFAYELIFGLEAKDIYIVNLDKNFGKGADDQLLKLGEEGFRHYIDKAVKFNYRFPEASYSIPQSPIISFALPERINMDIPPVEYNILWQGRGINFLTAEPAGNKTNFGLAHAIEMTTEGSAFLDRFDVKPTRVLYLDLEMGEQALIQRLRLLHKGMRREVSSDFRYISKKSFSLSEKNQANRAELEAELAKWKTEVLFIDPLYKAGIPNLIDNDVVSEFMSYLGGLIDRYGLTIIILHHLRKLQANDHSSHRSRTFGSFALDASADVHVGLAGDPSSITVTCEKLRNSTPWKPFIIKLNAPKEPGAKEAHELWFEYISEYKPKATEATLEEVFSACDKDRVSIKELTAKAEELKEAKQGGCGASTLRKLIKKSRIFKNEQIGRDVFVYRNEDSIIVKGVNTNDSILE